MSWWSQIKQRQRIRSEFHRRMDVQKARIAACNRELEKIADMKYPAYRYTWGRLLDNYQELLILEKNSHHCNFFWIVTGKRLPNFFN